MTKLTRFLLTLATDDQGQDLIEYTLLMAFIALASAALLTMVSGGVSGIWAVSNNQLDAAATSAGS